MHNSILINLNPHKRMIVAVTLVFWAAGMQCLILIRFSNALLTDQNMALLSVSRTILIITSITGMFFYWILVTLLLKSSLMITRKINTDFRVLMQWIGWGFFVFVLSGFTINIILNGYLNNISSFMSEHKNMFSAITAQTPYKTIHHINQSANFLLWIWAIVVIKKINRLSIKDTTVLFITLVCIFGLLEIGIKVLFRS